MRIRKLVLIVALVAAAAPLTALADECARAVHFQGADSGPFTITPIPGSSVVFTQDVATGKANRGIGRYTLVASELLGASVSTPHGEAKVAQPPSDLPRGSP